VHESAERSCRDVLYRRGRLLGSLREGGALAFETTSSRLPPRS
jgi:hypothetical protein